MDNIMESIREPELNNFITISNDRLELQDNEINYHAAKRKYFFDRALKSLDLPSMHLLQGITKSRSELQQALERVAHHQLQKDFPFSEITRMTMQTPLQDAINKLMDEVAQTNAEIEHIELEIEKLQTAQQSLHHKQHESFPLLEYYEAPLDNDREAIIKQNISKRIYELQAQLYKLKQPSSLSLLGCVQEYINQEVPSKLLEVE